ncbi:hypothetical protein WJX73_002276 [Symbiochloris irregularis]|uniref:HMG box domain-containing protein n=1 Tax=Symbiochloris irregularis TaxID=706552 RepID=A0AAW1P079_9CHLO
MPKAAAKKTESKAKGKAKKDPNAPKRPAGAYIFFCSAKRPEVKKKNPDLSAPDTLRELGALWSKATEEDKKPFYAQAVKDKERFQKEDAAYKKKKSSKAEEEEEEEEDDE